MKIEYLVKLQFEYYYKHVHIMSGKKREFRLGYSKFCPFGANAMIFFSEFPPLEGF